MPPVPVRPTRAQLDSAIGVELPDLIGPNLRLLLVGINPGRYSGATRHHFGNPASRLWPALHDSGLTPRRLDPADAEELLALGIGITNFVMRTTKLAKDLRREEIRDGADALRRKVLIYRPRVVAILGKGAFEIGFRRNDSTLGPQHEDLEGARLWVLPNPSPLNARYPQAILVALFRQLRQTLET